MVVTGFTGPYTLTEQMRKDNDETLHICAGSGVVPSFSIIKHDLKVNTKLKHTLIYSNKKYEDIIFSNELDALQKEFPERVRVIHTLTREENPAAFNGQMRKGRISQELLENSIREPSSTAVFVCGPDHHVWEKREAKKKGEVLPPSFMSSALSYLDGLGVPKDKITKESYG